MDRNTREVRRKAKSFKQLGKEINLTGEGQSFISIISHKLAVSKENDMDLYQFITAKISIGELSLGTSCTKKGKGSRSIS